MNPWCTACLTGENSMILVLVSRTCRYTTKQQVRHIGTRRVCCCDGRPSFNSVVHIVDGALNSTTVLTEVTREDFGFSESSSLVCFSCLKGC